MSPQVIAIVLFAALLHAGWNFLVKRSDDAYQGMCAVVLGRVPYGLAVLLVYPSVAASSYLYVVIGALLHVGYQLFLQHSYRFGDLSQVYPMARGSAPLIVALVSVSLLNVSYDDFQVAALAFIVAGLISLAWRGFSPGAENRYRAAILAIGAGIFIASYTLIDGLGARIAGTALGYYGSVTVLNALIYGVAINRLRPGLVSRVIKHHWLQSLASGGASFSAYALVVWAFTREPIALVASLRETSILFSVLLGAGLLKERLTVVKALAIVSTVTGVVLLRVGG
ncbi:MAG: DMT family transporter [Desulfofustis sp.]|nr:DMT family transporter [Desulfofustis sp.]MBT8353774.1 DMT family transporter [Desulfofustis sp.]NNK56376.1 EamA family transporter [Desulfofustis sp.]